MGVGGMSSAAELLRERERLFVVDDDPTGSQTVAEVPLLLRFEDADLRWALDAGGKVVFALTNSRALPESEAVEVNEDLGARAQALASAAAIELRVLSRGDSTLRGHFPAEVSALDRGLRRSGAPRLDGILLCPAFVESGRVTVGDVHWVAQDGERVPVGQTEFARDPVFGYADSNLRDWVAERTGGDRDAVDSVTLADIRDGGAERVAHVLGAARDARTVILNAEERSDLDVLARGVATAERAGWRFLYRTGPSFVAARAGLPTPEPIDPPPLAGPPLVVVGSHTELTNRQLRAAVAAHDLSVVELSVAEVVGGGRARAAEVQRAVGAALDALGPRGVAVVTSRAQLPTLDPGDAVASRRAISTSVTETVRRIVEARRPGIILAKGGITSHSVAQDALATGRATVLGQLFPGQISLWRLDDSVLAPGLPYVVFPGNVGGAGMLADALGRLTGVAV
jgi:uncharacterized protein YgbK (DUF1537 family)